MALNDVIIPAGADFVEPQVPAQKNFKKAHEVIRAAIEAANPDAAGKLDWSDFKALVNAQGNTVALSLVESPKNRYVLDSDLVFSYNDIQLIDVLTRGLGFASVYAESQKDAVVAALDSTLFQTEYNEATQVLTVTVKATANSINFTGENTTPATALLVGKTAQISFVDIVDISELLVTRTLNITVADLVEATPGA